ncbi:MFS transporter [Nocardiopsis sp. HNM0947]|uniref:MFS transporter n=1 Tax=Nocardiopsis coralli TaxID=2772213 RepID=A0ABR9PB39_9ACTN|nr:MFS transporter [Nocardiopsis coralli]MBE3001056.1 MFS transporter [Nocardiopsis coralli]
MRRFSLVWSTQLLSAIGSGTAWFAVTLWVWAESGSATLFALLTLLSLAPGLAMAPVAGVLVDRIGPRVAVLFGDAALAVTTSTVLALYLTGTLEIWHLFVIAVFEGVMESLHLVAYMALVPLLVAEERLVRANGMISLVAPGSEILGPALGGVLLALTDLSLILLLDLVTFVFAAVVLLLVRTPRPVAAEGEARRSWAVFRADLSFGFTYIFGSRPLVILLLLFFVLNFSGAISYALTTPLIMLRSGDDEALLGVVLAAGGVGGVMGALAVSAVGDRFRRMTLVLAGMAVGSVAGPLLLGLSWAPWLWIASSLLAGSVLPAVNSAYQAIWQSHVPEQQQGRVFGARRLLAQSSLPLGLLVAGPVVDYVLTPLFADTGAGPAVPLLGADKTGATAFFLAFAGLLGLAAALLAMTSSRLRGFGEPAADSPEETITNESRTPT